MSNSNLTKEEQKLKVLEVTEAREAQFRLVAKIISWKTRAFDSVSLQNQEKISRAEWEKYEKHFLNISKTEDISVVKEKLKKTYTEIKNNHGFE